MGYFSNGTEGMMYEEDFCDRCVHQKGPDGKSGCAVWAAHMLYNYKHCNDEDSILHILIPMAKDRLGNEQCLLFIEDKRIRINDEASLSAAEDYLKRGNKPEALIHLWRALGGIWERIFS